MNSTDFKSVGLKIPENPGIYKFIDKDHEIIYVGKAKNLRKRVRSYFTKNKYVTHKTALMVRRAVHVDFTIVDTESDALLLENSLIKKHQPRFNIALKDGKSYPYICIKNERFPRVFPTRTVIKDGTEYFGPYTSVASVNALMDLVTDLFPLRNCNFNLSEENINKKKFKVCLEYHIGNCYGPCEGLELQSLYDKKISQIRHILKGNTQQVIHHFKHEMEVLSTNFKFEKAQEIKVKLDKLENFKKQNTIVHPKINNVDVYAIVDTDRTAYINYLRIINGSIVQTNSIQLKKQLSEDREELLLFAIIELRNRYSSDAKEILLPFNVKLSLEGVKILVPRKGDKKKLLDLAMKNAKYAKLNAANLAADLYDDKVNKILETVQHDFKLKDLPIHIECFDNSNFQGANPVAAMVLFRHGKKRTSEYRHYNIKTVTGPDDFASMTEIVFRRYKRLKEEKRPLPQLVIIDGGKGQLSSAIKSLKKLKLEKKIAIVAIAKRLEEIYFPNDPYPLYIDKRSPSIRLVQQLRNEAHRFAISFHRLKRKKSTLRSELSDIKGVGKLTEEKLLRHFHSVKKISLASIEQIAEVVGKQKAVIINEGLQKK